jgi:hypothetical protein
MPTTYYHTVAGRILGETTSGVRTDYLTDALGSVTATVDASQNVINTYRYKPYGEQLAKTGSGADPRFRWVGAFGTATLFSALAFDGQRAYLIILGRFGGARNSRGYLLRQLTQNDLCKLDMTKAVRTKAINRSESDCGACGAVSLDRRYERGPLFGKKGWLIQKMQISQSVDPCHSSLSEPPSKTTFDYWEVWYFDGDEFRIRPTGRDVTIKKDNFFDRWCHSGVHECTKGNTQWTSAAAFFELPESCASILNWTEGTGKPRGILLGSEDPNAFPGWDGNSSTLMQDSLVTSWNCCPKPCSSRCELSKTVVVKPTSSPCGKSSPKCNGVWAG